MMQRATPQTVEANFAQGQASLHGSTYLMRASGSNFYISESDLTGKRQEHHVDFVLGVRRVQHYLSKLSDGRIILIPAAWDNVAKKWVHDVDIGNPEEAGGDPILIWNKTCYSCHVTHEQKNYDADASRYDTRWSNPGVGCESCHGPGKEHVAHATRDTIVNPSRLDPARSVAVCAQCHSNRYIYADGFRAGDAYYDYFLPALEFRLAASPDPAFWPDGTPRWFANEAVALSQSQCFLKGGATCLTCHSQPHNSDVEQTPRLRANSNSLCAGCHKTIASQLSAHTHHAPASRGSLCIDCHMPAITSGLKALMRDHSMSIPVPENTARYQIPNACNLCHREKDAAWTQRQLDLWYGAKSRRRTILLAGAFTAARQANPASIQPLVETLADPSEPPWIRANAVGYLSNFPDDPAAHAAVLQALGDSDPLVRATATRIKASSGEREAIAISLVRLLGDPMRSVRMSAAIALVSMGVKPFPGEDGRRFEQAKDQYRARAALFADDAEQQFTAGQFFLLSGDAGGAAAAFGNSLKLRPSTAAQYMLGQSLDQKGDLEAAKRALGAIPRTDSLYDRAQALLSAIEAKHPEGPAPQSATEKASGDPAHAIFLQGQVSFNGHYYQAALNDFDNALKAAPRAEWSVQARIDRAICLEKLARASEAESAIDELSTEPAARQNLDLQFAYVELLFDSGRFDDAEKRIAEVVRGTPGSAEAHFWRARILLQLRRLDEAAAAAEQSIRLDPEFFQSHNLLISIYQLQGRAQDAAQQAEWLREYQRRAKQR